MFHHVSGFNPMEIPMCLLGEAKAKAAGMSVVVRNAQPLPTGGGCFFDEPRICNIIYIDIYNIDI